MTVAEPDLPEVVQFREDLEVPSWGFFDETWSNFFAGFLSKSDAEVGLSQYYRHLNHGGPYCVDYPTKLYWTN